MGDLVVDGLADAVRALPPAADDESCVARIRALEELRSAVAAVQAQQTAVYVSAQRREAVAARADRVLAERRIASVVSMARRVSPYAGRRYVGWAMILTGELPSTLATLKAGKTSEWRPMLVARETAWLSREDRAAVDADMAPRLEKLGDRRVEAETRKLAYALDPAGAVARTAVAESERRVTLRPAPDAMTRLGALLPGPQGIAAYTTLARDADALIGTGRAGGRTRGQVMADLLVARVTGQDEARDLPVEVNLIMSAETLFHGGDEPATVVGVGPVPAEQARHLVRDADDRTPMWIRRLYRSPSSGELMQMDSRRREFTATQRRFIRLRDEGICATDWCDAPARHADHIRPATAGGVTSVANGESLCADCNYTKGSRTNADHDAHAPPETSAA